MLYTPVHHLRSPPQNLHGELPPCLRPIRKSWSSTRGQGQNINAMEGSSLLPAWDNSFYQTYLSAGVQPSYQKNFGIQKNICKATHTHTRGPPICYPAYQGTNENCCWPTMQHDVLQKVEVPVGKWYGQGNWCSTIITSSIGQQQLQ